MKIMLFIKYLSNKDSLGFFLHHSSSLDKETKAAYDNYNSSDWKSSIFGFPEVTTTNRKNGDPPRKNHTDVFLDWASISTC